MKILEWNLNKRSKSNLAEPYVYKNILSQQADIICLVEYTEDMRIKTQLEKQYWIFESEPLSGNQILIGINISMCVEKPTVIRNYDEPNCFNILHVRLKNMNGEHISVVGVRMLTGANKNSIDANIQTPPLNVYLENIKEPFLCIGDYNIREQRLLHWFPKYKMQTMGKVKRYLEKASYLFTKNDGCHCISNYGALDHILTNTEWTISAKYSWEYIKDHNIYPEIEQIKIGSYWNVPVGFPDHAIMIADVIVTD